MMDSNTQ